MSWRHGSQHGGKNGGGKWLGWQGWQGDGKADTLKPRPYTACQFCDCWVYNTRFKGTHHTCKCGATLIKASSQFGSKLTSSPTYHQAAFAPTYRSTNPSTTYPAPNQPSSRASFDNDALATILGSLSSSDGSVGDLATQLRDALQSSPVPGPQPMSIQEAQFQVQKCQKQFDKAVQQQCRAKEELERFSAKVESTAASLVEAEEAESAAIRTLGQAKGVVPEKPANVIDLAAIIQGRAELQMDPDTLGLGGDLDVDLEPEDKAKLTDINKQFLAQLTEATKSRFQPVLDELRKHFADAKSEAAKVTGKRRRADADGKAVPGNADAPPPAPKDRPETPPPHPTTTSSSTITGAQVAAKEEFSAESAQAAAEEAKAKAEMARVEAADVAKKAAQKARAAKKNSTQG